MKALRTLRRAPVFTIIVVMTLALGLGPGTAVFSAIDRLLLQRLPYPEPGRLVALHETQSGKGIRPVSLPNLLDWRAQASGFDGVAGFMTRSFGLRYQGSPVTVITTGMVTSDLFRVLSGGPNLGRSFSEREELQGERLIVLTDDLWARRFQRTRDIVGGTVQINEQPYQVIGVLPPEFVFPAPGTRVDAYIPISHEDYGARGARPLQAVGRLRPGLSFAAAQSELNAIGTRLAERYPEDNAGGGALMESLDAAWKGGLRRPLFLLGAAALLLLAIVCSNVVNLILMRSLARSWEMDIRRALGARLSDIASQTLGESLLLCGAGGALGMLLASGVLRALPLLLHQPAMGLALNARALTFASATCLLTTVLCGMAPVLPMVRRRRPARLRYALVAGQVALSLMLLLSAGLFLRVFLKLADRDPGFESSHVFYFGFGLPEGKYSDRQMAEFHGKLRERLREIPGVEAAGAVWRLPLNGRNSSTSFQFEGAGLPPTLWSASALNIVDPDFFPVLRIPLRSGRTLDVRSEGPGRPLALLVNHAFEKKYGDVLGKRLQLRFWTDLVPRDQLWQIVGVVGDTYQGGLDQSIRPEIYLPISQTGLDGGDYLIRTARSDAGLETAVAAAVRSLDPNLERINVRRLDDWVSQSLGSRRFPAILTGLFAGIGLALTALGLYGAIALEVGQRRKEMAIRVAIGATSASIIGLVMARGLLLTLAGAAVGAIGFIAGGRLIANQLYEVAPSDPVNAVTVLAILFTCAICACLGPAWGALRQEPVAILREL